MKRAFIILAIIVGIALSGQAFAGAETGCYAYSDANALIYCLRALKQRGTIRTQGIELNRSAVYRPVSSQQIGTTIVRPAVSVYTPQVGYSYVPAARAQPPSDSARIISALGAASAGMLGASAWAYNWRHGYVGAQGIYSASYMMNYPW